VIFALRIACRTLAKSPAFSLTAIAALALGIGANTAIFSVINQVLLHPAGVSDPERVVALRAKYDKLSLKNIPVSIPDFADVQKSTQLFESGAVLGQGSYNYTGSGVPERLQGATVSQQWLDVFGAKPQLGRIFQPEEDRPNANQVVVLSFAAWKRLFGQDSGVLGRTMELNGMPYRIVGVMGPEFRWPASADLWIPLGLPADAYDQKNRFNEAYTAFVRLKPGVPLSQASAFVDILANRVRNDGTSNAAFARDSAWGMFLAPFTDFVAGDTKTPLLVLLASVGFVLLIACSNIAGLMLARASGRSREIAVRAALGAGRWDLIRQTLLESLVLSFAGAAAGLGLAFAGVRGLLAFAPQDAAVALNVRMDATVLLFTAGAAIAAGILFGIIPAWQISRLDRFDALKEGGRSGSAGLRRQRLRGGLVIGEVALALVLLVSTGLFLRSLASLEEVNPGFSSQGVMTGFVALPPNHYKDPAKEMAFYRAVLDGLKNQAGVSMAAAAVQVPFNGQTGSSSFAIQGRPSPPGDPGPHGDVGFVTPGYFEALRIPLMRGRVFTDQDQSGTTRVALVDDTLAREYWPNEDPVGKHIRLDSNDPWATIVGIVGHTKNTDLAGDTVKGKYYFSMLQSTFLLGANTFLVHTSSDPARASAALRDAVHAVDPTLAVSQMRLLSDMVARSLAPRRFVVTLLGIFAALALLMAVIGLYGVISYSVAQRTQELGIRMALGAQTREVLGLVIGEGMQLAGAGALIGLGVSLAFSRLLKNQLFRVSAFDPLTFGVMALVLIAAALSACYIPARRATRVDPMEALRYE
jgi:predicted permease